MRAFEVVIVEFGTTWTVKIAGMVYIELDIAYIKFLHLLIPIAKQLQHADKNIDEIDIQAQGCEPL